MSDWIDAWAAGDTDEKDVIRFDHTSLSHAIYRSLDERSRSAGGFCTHRQPSRIGCRCISVADAR